MTTRYEGKERRAEYGWHLRKEVNLSHLIATIGLAASLFMWGHKMDLRIALLEDRIASQATVDSRQDASSSESLARLDTRLDSIDGKLDRLVEWQMRKYSMERGSQ